MKLRAFAALLLAGFVCGCANPAKDKNKTPQEKTMQERYYSNPMTTEAMARHSQYDFKPYQATGTAAVRDYRTDSYGGSKAAPVKGGYGSKSFLGIGGYGGTDKTVSTSSKVLPQNTSMPGSNQSFFSKVFGGGKTYHGTNTVVDVHSGVVPVRTTSVPGAASKDSLSAEGKALDAKVQKGELTIDQVREILNKDR